MRLQNFIRNFRIAAGRSPREYRLRQVMVLSAAVVIVLGLFSFVVMLSSGPETDDLTQAKSMASDSPSTSAPSDTSTDPSEESDADDTKGEEKEAKKTEEPKEPAEPKKLEECATNQLGVQIVSAFEEAYVGTIIPVSVLVSNSSTTDCFIKQDAISLQALAGEDIVYSSAHCSKESSEATEADKQIVLAPKGGKNSEFKFPSTASSEECAGEGRKLPAGDYTLRAVARAAAASADDSTDSDDSDKEADPADNIASAETSLRLS